MAHFSGQAIVITGASSGIGRALAIELAAQGPNLVLAARDRSALEDVSAECQQRGASTLIVPTDVTDVEQCQALVQHGVERFGRIDVLINNAGAAMWARFDALKELSVIENLIRINYLGSVHSTHFALKHLKQARGLIVGMASISGLMGIPLLSGYAASKHALVGFYESLRIELAGSGVDVTIAVPDFVQSRILPRAVGADGQPIEMSPLDQTRLLSAEKCARIVVKAMSRRKRLVFTSHRSTFGRWGQLLAPGLTDWIAARAVGAR
jgi:short-subunit dehydrogenase